MIHNYIKIWHINKEKKLMHTRGFRNRRLPFIKRIVWRLYFKNKQAIPMPNWKLWTQEYSAQFYKEGDSGCLTVIFDIVFLCLSCKATAETLTCVPSAKQRRVKVYTHVHICSSNSGSRWNINLLKSLYSKRYLICLTTLVFLRHACINTNQPNINRIIKPAKVGKQSLR